MGELRVSTGKRKAKAWRRLAPVLGLAAVAGLAGLLYAGLDLRSIATAGSEGVVVETTASLKSDDARAQAAGRLKLPRFVSLKSDRVNVRRGPSSDHAIAWVFNRKGLPLEIIAEFEHWRRVRDSEGEEGWVYQSLLTGRRTALVAPWIQGKTVPMLHDPESRASVVALLGAGVIGEVESCSGAWCRLNVDGHEGWIDQSLLWGVYPGEQIDN
jgi:SH3-like domain-containing protein